MSAVCLAHMSLPSLLTQVREVQKRSTMAFKFFQGPRPSCLIAETKNKKILYIKIIKS